MKCKKIYALFVLILCSCGPQSGGSSPSLSTNANQNANQSGSGAPLTLSSGVVASPTPDSSSSVSGGGGGIALIYSGDGICEEDCAAAAAQSATLAGFTPRLVVGNSLAENATAAEVTAFFKDVRVWVEPGGYATQSYDGMTTKLQTSLRNFVEMGGGYVGWCAGAFMSNSSIGTTGSAGLGVFPGNESTRNGSTDENILWNGKNVSMYWEGGGYLYNLPASVEVIAYYSDKTVAAARTTFGLGRVFVSGVHPEAPGWWWGDNSYVAPKGPNQGMAADMIKWAAGQE